MCNFGRRHYKEQLCEIILNLDQWFRRRCCLKAFLSWSCGGPFFSAELNHLCTFGRGYYEEQFCGIIFNLVQWFLRRCLLKIFLIWSSGGPFMQQSICAILVEGIKRNKTNSMNLYPPTKGYLRETCKSQNINPIYLTLSSPSVSFRS